MPYINCRKLCVSEKRRARNAGFLTPEQRRGQAARDRQLHEAVFGSKDLTSPVTVGRIRSMTLMVKDNSWPPVKIAFQNKINDWFPAIVHLLFHRSSSKFDVLVKQLHSSGSYCHPQLKEVALVLLNANADQISLASCLYVGGQRHLVSSFFIL